MIKICCQFQINDIIFPKRWKLQLWIIKKKQTSKTTIKQQTTTKNDPFVVGCRHQCHNPVLVEINDNKNLLSISKQQYYFAKCGKLQLWIIKEVTECLVTRHQ